MSGEVTRYLAVLGDAGADTARRAEARDRLFELLYDELRRIAGAIARGSPTSATLQATAILHEAYARLAACEPLSTVDREHFLRTAALAMRRVILDHSRARRARKRGGRHQRVPLDDLADAYAARAIDLDGLDAQLEDLAETHPRAAAAVDLHFFGGLSAPEIARVFDVSSRTIRREIEFARTWLRTALS